MRLMQYNDNGTPGGGGSLHPHPSDRSLPRRGRFICGDASDQLLAMPRSSVDMVVTSPPYDSLRSYDATGTAFHAKEVIAAIAHALKPGGICCWIVADKIKDGDRSLTSFKHAFHARDAGLANHELIIWDKGANPFPRTNAYYNHHEFVFVWCKGQRPRAFNPIKEPTRWAICATRSRYTDTDGRTITERHRTPNWQPEAPIRYYPDDSAGTDPDGRIRARKPATARLDKPLGNVWRHPAGGGKSTKDQIAYRHPAIAPESLVRDLILSWSNPGDLVVDPMCGSGTTCKMAAITDRQWIGIDISGKYLSIARRRMEGISNQARMEF